MAASGEPSIADLVRKTISDAQKLVRAQIALTQAELTATSEAVARAGIFAVLALVCVSLFGIFLLVTIAYAFVAMGLPVWAGFGIVSLVLLITAVVCGLVARNQAQQIQAPRLALGELTKTRSAIASVEQPGR
jgi:hypothetical protein